MSENQKIIWTKIDEAPALATYSLLPIVQAFTKGTGVEVETWDISLAGRIISLFPERLSEEQQAGVLRKRNIQSLGCLTKEQAEELIDKLLSVELGLADSQGN